VVGCIFFLCFLCVGLSAALEIGDRVCERVREKKINPKQDSIMICDTIDVN